jgi:hypothetical protein
MNALTRHKSGRFLSDQNGVDQLVVAVQKEGKLLFVDSVKNGFVPKTGDKYAMRLSHYKHRLSVLESSCEEASARDGSRKNAQCAIG